MVVCILHNKRTLFLDIILDPEKESKKIKSQNGRTLFPKIFYVKDFFPLDFFKCQNLGLYIFENPFSENFFGGHPFHWVNKKHSLCKKWPFKTWKISEFVKEKNNDHNF